VRYRLLGNSGLRVSEMCLGTMTFGEDWGWGTPKDDSRKIYDAFREAGGNFFDTANFYTNGSSETLLGEFIQGHRESVVLATKYSNAPPGKDPNAAGNHRKSMMQAVEGSLRRLKTDYIDLYWLHIWDTITPFDEVMRSFDDLTRQGKILYAGVSNAPAWWIARANTLAELRGWNRFAGVQVEYSLIERTVERELLPMSKALGLGVTAWSPLAGGWLSGKYSEDRKTGGRLDEQQWRDNALEVNERSKAIVAEVATVARETGHSSAQVALAWLHHRDLPVTPIIGARKIEQLQDNLASLELKLTTDQRKRLDSVSRIQMGFPHDFLDKELVQAFSFGGLKNSIDAP
jgi:aryl-alcohol dehydrogenase-like predicted oxidoreductase